MDQQTKTTESKNGFAFRKSIGGFNKDDVIDFISDENRKFKEERERLCDKADKEAARALALEREIAELEEKYELLLAKKDEQIETANSALAEAEEKIAAFEKVAADYDAKVAEYEKKVEDYEEKLDSLEKSVRSQDSIISSYEKKTSYLAARCEDLEASLAAVPAVEVKDETPAPITNEDVKTQDLPVDSTVRKAPDAAAKKVAPAPARESARRLSYGSVPYDGQDDSEKVAEKAISAIKLINEDVRRYLQGCVGEFDSCSKDITKAISELLYVISERCRMLDEKLKSERECANRRIEQSLSDFENKYIK